MSIFKLKKVIKEVSFSLFTKYMRHKHFFHIYETNNHRQAPYDSENDDYCYLSVYLEILIIFCLKQSPIRIFFVSNEFFAHLVNPYSTIVSYNDLSDFFFFLILLIHSYVLFFLFLKFCPVTKESFEIDFGLTTVEVANMGFAPTYGT